MTDSRAGESRQAGEGGPVPVRDLMRRMTPAPETGADAEPAWEAAAESFDVDGEAWVARAAGTGSYGTGRLGAARLVAVHFFRKSDPETPVREALVAAGRFPHLRAEELRSLLDSATPIERDR